MHIDWSINAEKTLQLRGIYKERKDERNRNEGRKIERNKERQKH